MFSSIFGEQDQGPSAAETIERLCSRLSTATLPEDRRSAVKGIRAMTNDYQVEVANQGMPLLIKVLQQDRDDVEITNVALEGLIGMMRTAPTEEGAPPSEDDVGVMFTEIFVKSLENVALLLSLLQEVDFHVRLNTVKLLTMLLTNRSSQLQECILTDPTGISRLMELLSDGREIIRNEGLLLVGELTKANPAIQKIVAFESAFERALAIIADEGYSDGDIIVMDCLRLIQNLLRGNESNQILFRENSCIVRLVPFFKFEAPDPSAPAPEAWDSQKVMAVQKMLQVVRLLISPDNSKSSLAVTQGVIRSTGLLEALGSFALSATCPKPIVAEALATVAEAIRAQYHSQEFFGSFTGAGGLSSLVVVLYCAFGAHRAFRDRCAALYCFNSYLQGNTAGQSKIVAQLFPTGSEPQVAAGTLLCQGLFSDKDPLACWFAAMGLSYVLAGNLECKESMLRVAVASAGNQPSSLLGVVVARLARTKPEDLRRRVAFFILVDMWLCESVFAVKTFLQIPNSVAFLVSQVGEGANGGLLVEGLAVLALGLCIAHNDDTDPEWTRDALRKVVETRVGMETFFGKLERFVNSEALGASKRPMIEAESADDAWFDVEISRSLRAMIAPVTAAVKGETGAQMQSAVPASDATVNYHDQVVQQYKEMIRSQDEELRRAKAEITRLQATTEASPTPPADAAGATVLSTPDPAFGRQLAAAEEKVASLQAQVTELTQERDLARVEAAAAAAAPPPSTPEGSNGTEAALADMQSSLNAAHADMQELYNQNEALRSRVQELESLAASATEHAAADKSALERKLAAKMDEFEVVNKEHEDMLILLAQQHQKLARYTEKLLAFGSELTESEEEGESSSEVESEVGEIESEVESELGKIE